MNIFSPRKSPIYGRFSGFCNLLYLKIPENFVSFILQDRFWFVHLPFGRIVKFRFLAQFQEDHLLPPFQSCLLLYSFCTSLLHSHIIWLMVSSLSAHNLNWLFCCFRFVAIYRCVTYWPPTRLSDEKCTCVNNRCIRSKILRDNLDCRRVELSVNCR